MRGIFYNRHFCERCGIRVFPYDTLERQTQAPGESALLSSANARRARKGEDKLAWCWRCERWVKTVRATWAEIVRRYASRKGVVMRTIKVKKRNAA